MKKLSFFLFSFFFIGCSTSESKIKSLKYNFESMSFDVVEKDLIIEKEIPDNVKILINEWFNSKIKINGFDGQMIFKITEYTESVSSIQDGKKVEIYLSFKVILDKSHISQKKIIDGEVFSYGTLTGNFSLSDFDEIIKNTQGDLILRLSRDLKSKF